MDFLQKIENYISHNQLFDKSNKLLVAVSGGADSVVLLHALVALGYQCSVAHCNFHLRGKEANDDALFVANLAEKYRLQLFKIDFETEQYANSKKISIEMAARELRYNWFEQIRQQNNFDYIVVAHHANDNAETCLLNLARGTGIRGLRGMLPKNERIVRPLLCVTRHEIENFAQTQTLDYRTDSTNSDTQYTRNYIRHDILPQFEQINPNFVTTMAENLQHLCDVNAIFDEYINQKRVDLCKQNDGTFEIDVTKLQNYTAANTILFEILKDFGFNSTQTNLIFDNIGTSGLKFNSEHFCLITNREKLLIQKSSATDNKEFTILQDTQKLSFPINMQIDFIEKLPEIDKQNRNIVYFDADKIEFPLTLRHWQQGDTFVPFGMSGSKKLSDFFVDQKLSLIEKSQQWLLCDNKHILWVVGMRASNHYKITNSTKRVVQVTYIL